MVGWFDKRGEVAEEIRIVTDKEEWTAGKIMIVSDKRVWMTCKMGMVSDWKCGFQIRGKLRLIRGYRVKIR